MRSAVRNVVTDDRMRVVMLFAAEKIKSVNKRFAAFGIEFQRDIVPGQFCAQVYRRRVVNRAAMNFCRRRRNVKRLMRFALNAVMFDFRFVADRNFDDRVRQIFRFIRAVIRGNAILPSSVKNESCIGASIRAFFGK